MPVKLTLEFELTTGFDQALYQDLLKASAALAASHPGQTDADAFKRAALMASGGAANVGVAMAPMPPSDATQKISEPVEETSPEEAAAEDIAHEAATVAAALDGNPPPARRPRRSKAQIEADNASTAYTLATARQAGLVPVAPPAAPALPPAPPKTNGIAIPPGAAVAAPVAPPVPTPIAVPPAAVAQTPSMPVTPPAPPPVPGAQMTVAQFREAQRQINAAYPSLPFRITSPKGYYTPESIPPEQYESLLMEMHAAMETYVPSVAT
jgi:hypothetical protein